jgi:RNA polymerase sigma-70 factor (ECF subfamily)
VAIDQLPSNDLARLCAVQGGAEEWREFVRRFSRPIALSVYRVARLWGETSTAIIEDIVQDVFLKFCTNDRKILRDFEPRHAESFLAFVKVVASATANDYFRKSNTAKRGGNAHEEEVTDLHPSIFQDSEWIERNLLLKQIDQLLDTTGKNVTAARDRTVFWLYYQQGMTAGAIASLPGISLTVKGVESALHRMTALIRTHLRHSTIMNTAEKKNPSGEGFTSGAAIQKGEWL